MKKTGYNLPMVVIYRPNPSGDWDTVLKTTADCKIVIGEEVIYESRDDKRTYFEYEDSDENYIMDQKESNL